ncbi:MAG: sulfotransferase, partial [Candidatus Thorarchaeota archaeon]|nr:sulfotransferase [Candidatus Thorarchaeota archaeon]
MRKPRGVHCDASGRGSPPGEQPVHAVQKLGVQSLECLLEDGIAWSSRKTEVMQQLRVTGELGHEGPVAETRVELEAQEDKESREGKVRRSSEGRGLLGDHSTKVDKLIKQELRVTRPGCVVRCMVGHESCESASLVTYPCITSSTFHTEPLFTYYLYGRSYMKKQTYIIDTGFVRMERPIFVLGAHKSGTGLLRSLLDGHTDLFTSPIEMHFFQYAKRWVEYSLRYTRPPHRSLKQTKQAYIQNVRRINTTSQRMGGSAIEPGDINMDYFEQEINKSVDSLKDLIRVYFDALYKGLYEKNRPSNKRIVEKSVENAEFVPHLKALFPDAKFLHIIRNPFSNLVSLRRYLSKQQGGGYPFLLHGISSMKQNYYHLYRNRELIPEDYFVVRYEDLVKEAEYKMAEVCEFLDIDFSTELLAPTSMGEAWMGNSSRGLEFSDVSTKNLTV